MSSSTVTYTLISSDYEEPSNIGSPGVVVYEYDGLPMHPPSPNYVSRPKHPPSPDYVPGPEHPPSPVYVLYVPEPEYPEYLVPFDAKAPLEDQPLLADASPTALSPGYVADSDPEEDPEEDHADYPIDGGDGDDEPSDDDDDDDDADDEDKEAFEDEDDDEEEEHLALVDSSTTRLRRAQKMVRPQTPIPFPPKAEGRWDSDESCITTLITFIYLHRTNIPEAEMPPRKRACFTTPAPGFEVRESSAAGAAIRLGPTLEADLRRDRVREMGYGITDTWDEIVEAMLEDTDEFYVQFEDAQDDRSFLRARTGSEDRSAAIKAHVRTLKAQVATLMAQTSSLQTQLTTSLRHIETLEARDPEPQDEPTEKMAPKKRTTRTSPTTTSTPMTDAQIQALIEQGVAAALAYRDADKSRNGDDSHDSGTGGRRQVSTVRECTYTDFLKCQPMNFKGTEGVVGLTQWLKKMESVFHISNCTIACQVKFASCTDVLSYNQRFQELALMCDRMFPEESGVVEKYVGGCPDMIHGSVENKRKFEDTSQKNQNQQQPFKRNNVARAYTAGPGEKKPYGGSKPMFPKCKYHHDGQCAPKSDFSKLRNINQGNRAGNGNAVARAYVVGTTGTNPNFNDVTGTFLLNNRYASILFNTGTNRSFVSTAFSSLIDIIPTTLDHGYDVELADGRIIWLSKYHAIIVCDEKLIRVPFGNKILTFHGDGSNNRHESRLNIISCTKTQKCLLKGCPIFLAHVTTKKAKDKSKEKRLEDVPIVQDFPEVFLEDLPGIPPTYQVEFQIDLIIGVTPVARAPYRLASSETKELSDQLKELFDKCFIRPSSSP
ncbi:hypothetical protein Tco_0067256 [Tanacetum coccineum]